MTDHSPRQNLPSTIASSANSSRTLTTVKSLCDSTAHKNLPSITTEIDKIIISSPNIQAPAANLPCIKLVSDVNRNLSLANVENVGFIARNSLNGYPESITQMFTDQANTITQNPLNASFDNLDISLQGSRSDMCIDQADTVTQNSMSAFFESINNALTPDSEMFTDQAYTIFSDQAQTCTQKPLDLFYAGNTRQDYDDAVNNNS